MGIFIVQGQNQVSRLAKPSLILKLITGRPSAVMVEAARSSESLGNIKLHDVIFQNRGSYIVPAEITLNLAQ